MNDDFERQLSRQLSDIASDLPFLLTAEDVLRRDKGRTRVSLAPIIAAVALGAASALVVALLIRPTGELPVATSSRAADPASTCHSAVPVTRGTGQREVGGPAAFFDWPFGTRPEAGTAYKLLIRLEGKPSSSPTLVLEMSGTPGPGAGAQRVILEGQETPPHALAGSYFFTPVAVDTPGCWRMSIWDAGAELGSATINFEPKSR